MNERISEAAAIEQSLQRWHAANPERGRVPRCGLCQRYKRDDSCGACPLRARWRSACKGGNTPYAKWVLTYPTHVANKYADEIYAELVAIKKEMDQEKDGVR